MGWLFGPMPQEGIMNWFKDHLTEENEKRSYKPLDVSKVGNTLYAAVERIDKETGDRIVWAAVYLIQMHPKSSHPFGYKDMDETVGPNEARCPERLLNKLTPIKEGESEYALDWRARCWENIKLSKLIKNGALILLDKPMVFGQAYHIGAFVVNSNVPWSILGIYPKQYPLRNPDRTPQSWASVKVKFSRVRLMEILRYTKARICTLSEINEHFNRVASGNPANQEM